MAARRVQSLHHNLGEGNVIFHRNHRSKKGRIKDAIGKKALKRMLQERWDRIERRYDEFVW